MCNRQFDFEHIQISMWQYNDEIFQFSHLYSFLAAKSMFPSKWTLCDVYMEASYVLSGLSAKCDLKLIAPKTLPCTCPTKCSQSKTLHKSTIERPDVACSSTIVDKEDNDVRMYNCTMAGDCMVPNHRELVLGKYQSV